MTNPPIVALLVGIDRYASDDVSDLSGCANDVTAMRQMLIDLYGAHPEHILTLTDEAATRDAILAAFRTHLIDTATAGGPDATAEPAAYLFHYSGHGSQAIDSTHTEPDGLDETLVPHDSRLPDHFDIKDFELGALLDELGKDTDNVTVILDSCHSGSATRAAAAAVRVGVRRCPPDLREQPDRRPGGTAVTRGGTRGLAGPSDWLDSAGAGYVLLAGCRDRQESSEMETESGVHGAFTHHLIRALSDTGLAGGGVPLTYAELHERVRHDVSHLFRDQVPQCEGACERHVFGGAAPERDPLFTVVERSGGFFWIDAGMAHGIAQDTVFAVYPPETRKLDDADAPIGFLDAVEVGAVRSGCTARATDGDGRVAIPLHARASIVRLADGAGRKTVLVEVANTALAAAIASELATDRAAPYLRPIEDGVPELRIGEGPDGIEIQDGAGARLVPPYAGAGATAQDLARAITSDLSTIVRAENVRSIRNQNASQIAGRVKVTFRHVEFDPDTQAPIPGPHWFRLEDGDAVIEDGQRVMIEVEHVHTEPLYIAVFDIDANHAVTPLYPPHGAQEALEAWRPLRIGLERTIRGALPTVRGGEAPTEVRQTIKVIASREVADFRKLALPGLGDDFVPRMAEPTRGGTAPSALDRLLLRSMNGGRLRLSTDPPSIGDEWTTATLDYLTIAAPEAGTARLSGGQTASLPFHAVQVQPPEGFEGSIRVLDPRQATRADGGDSADLHPPPGLAAYDQLGPLPLPARRSTERAGVVIEIEADEASRRMISDLRPLRLQLGTESGHGTVALAYDGTFHYPVGRSDAGSAIDLTWLPDPEDIPLRSTRDLRRTIKLYLYQLVGRSDPFLGLHHARFVPRDHLDTTPAQPEERALSLGSGEVRYRDVGTGDFQAGQRVALCVHGFNSDTRGIVSQLSTVLGESSPYDHLLSWDYESFATHVADNGADLGDALRRAGLDADEVRLDIYAHSMGTLVTRCLMEKLGGADFVDKVLLAGPPNEGTKLAEMKRYLTWLLTVAINQAAPIAPTLLAGWIVGKVSDDAVGAADLHPASAILEELNRGDGALHRRYHVLAGDYSETDEKRAAWKRMASKLSDRAADLYFKDDNDLVIDVASMRGSGRFRPDPVRVATVACDHFGYFSNPESVERMLGWMR